MTSSLRIVVTGLIAQYPLGGIAWHYLQYLIGLARLGHDVFYLEDTGKEPYAPSAGGPGAAAANVRYLAAIMKRFGLGDKWAYGSSAGQRWFGVSDIRREAVLQSADLLINVSGALQNPEHYRKIPRLVYIDSDPGFTQVRWTKDGGLRERLSVHDVWFTFGTCLSSPLLPETPFQWVPTHSPIVLEEWSRCPTTRNVWTTVMSWTSYRPLEYLGQQVGQKDLEFQRFIDLPARLPKTCLEVAMHLHRHADWESENDSSDPAAMLKQSGWQLTDSQAVASDIDSYRNYVRTSLAEWSVAKHGYVAAKTGWFSCRSACYLAAGRPVVLQDTGFSESIPADRGILAFESSAEAEECIREVEARPFLHSEAAREIAREHFGADKVLSRLVERAAAFGVDHAPAQRVAE